MKIESSVVSALFNKLAKGTTEDICHISTKEWYLALADHVKEPFILKILCGRGEFLDDRELKVAFETLCRVDGGEIYILFDSDLEKEKEILISNFFSNVVSGSSKSKGKIIFRKSSEKLKSHFSIFCVKESNLLFAERRHEPKSNLDDHRGFVAHGQDVMIPITLDEFSRLQSKSKDLLNN